MRTFSITWPGDVTKHGVNTQCSTIISTSSLSFTCLITRGETLTLSSRLSSWIISSVFFHLASQFPLFQTCFTLIKFTLLSACKTVLILILIIVPSFPKLLNQKNSVIPTFHVLEVFWEVSHKLFSCFFHFPENLNDKKFRDIACCQIPDNVLKENTNNFHATPHCLVFVYTGKFPSQTGFLFPQFVFKNTIIRKISN